MTTIPIPNTIPQPPFVPGTGQPIPPPAGTVTSVALTVPAEFSVAGSPITSSGTLAVTKANETANTVWAGPATGAAAQPAFRALVAADIPAGVGPSFADAEVPGGLINSANVTYTLAHAPSPAGSLQVFLNGLLQTAGGVDYTLSGSTITYGVAPSTGDALICWYRY